MQRLLIAGYGDIARRVADRLPAQVEARALARRKAVHERVLPLVADLDFPDSLARVGGWADAVLHCAPPSSEGEADARTARLLVALERGAILPSRMVYISTSGVYGDCAGALVDETRSLRPQTPRARRRVDAERRLTDWCARQSVALVILRVPGIYAADRLPLQHLRRGLPVLRDADDIYTNHIHADDLAAISLRSLEADAPGGIYNASDDTQMKMREWFDLLADRNGMPRPARVSRADAESRIPAETLSFMRESRRLCNRRLKAQLGVKLAYPTVREGVPACSLPREASA
ncbi:MAG: NAD-dependent epimerase/dehydratase family protein [Betaproteobacteria bacterium]|nr:NAD-dependent epimerase/dehydratase family protein [Betaproteobacteria bacterium]